MLRKRIASLFDLRHKKKGFTFILMIILLASTLGLCISCTQSTGSKSNDMIIYENKELGFSIELPQEWKDRYIIEELEDGIDIFSKKNYQGGLLFSLRRVIGELITEEDMKQAPVGQKIVLQDNGYTYFIRMPSDVQYPPDNEELSQEYTSMSEQVSEIIKSISSVGNQKPKALNEGFKVVGTSFFTLEIPSDCDIKTFEDSVLLWDIYKGNDRIGYIDMVPYKAIESTEENIGDENIIHMTNDEIQRKARIQLFTDDLDQTAKEKIKESFLFTDGPYNVVDLQFTAGLYLGGGGKKIFGKIEDIQMENGVPMAINIKVMEFISDGPDGEKNPNGFHIKDLNKIEGYSLESSVLVAPLVAPNYNTYGTYGIYPLDEVFIESYEHLKDFFYDFIIGKDGQLKIILGHYVP